jgi:hypothetical protein
LPCLLAQYALRDAAFLALGIFKRVSRSICGGGLTDVPTLCSGFCIRIYSISYSWPALLRLLSDRLVPLCNRAMTGWR